MKAQIAFDTSQVMITCNVFENKIYHFPSETIEDQLSCIENKIPLTYNVHTAGFINYFTIRRRSYIKSMMERKDLYFPMFEEKLKEHNLPDELKYLSIVESGLNAKAQSHAGASGLWQFISSTGKMMGLTINHDIDERMDPEKSTEAACKYLTNLHNTFGDWRYAIAAYNCGPGNVRKAQRNSGYSKDFWKVYNFLPSETRGYVPQFMAVMYAMNYAEEYNLTPDTLRYFPELDTIRINAYCNLDTFCSMLNYCFDDLVYLNRSLKRHYIPDSSNFLLKLPKDVIQNYIAQKQSIDDSCLVKAKDDLNFEQRIYSNNNTTEGKQRTYYKVKSGDYLGKIAMNNHVSVADLKKWNKITGNTINIGQQLVIWKTSSSHQPTPSNSVQVPIPDSKHYIVQPGDTLWNISNKFKGITLEQLKKLNNLQDNTIKPGQKLILG